MSNKPKHAASQGPSLSSDLDAWREEIDTFCRQAIANLQELAKTPNGPESTVAASASAEEMERAVFSVAATPPPVAPRDLDASQDRLANLKRELAAKLSSAPKNVK